MTAWVDCHGTPGYLGGYSADMGVYTGPWPIMFPPTGASEGIFGGEVDFTIMIPNPSDPGDVGIAGDDSYDTYIYGTYASGTPPTWEDCGWWNDYEGPTLTDSPLPPELQPGAHLYVTIYTSSGTPPTETPESFVPVSYGGANLFEWTIGEWSAVQAATSEVQSQSPLGNTSSNISSAIVSERQINGWTNNAFWAGGFTYIPLVVHSLPFPPFNLHSAFEALINSELQAAYPSTGLSGSDGLFAVQGFKKASDPGAGLGIKATEPGTSDAFLGQYFTTGRINLPYYALPSFFDTGYNDVWAQVPWDNRGTEWDPSGVPSIEMTDLTVGVTSYGSVTETGVTLSDPPDQVINIYAFETPYPWSNSIGFQKIWDTTGAVLVGSFTVSIDYATLSFSLPSTVALSMSALSGLVGDGAGHYGIGIAMEPAAWRTGIEVIDLPEPDAGSLGNGQEIIYSYHYGFGAYFNANTTDGVFMPTWEVQWPSYRYWVPGELVGSAPPAEEAYWGVRL